jgi:RHS repeat-associated protein
VAKFQGGGSGMTGTVYFYDGWNVAAECSIGSSSYTLARTYTWGPDLSGTFQGAGGVGGLLAVEIETGTDAGVYYPLCDGNGNVTDYMDNSYDLVAHYEYDPFGEEVVATGSHASLFNYRFSTKPMDAETGLYYYGYRYYDPVTGRWSSRDPVEEDGGLNLYAFVWNDGITAIDVLGLWTWQDTKETGAALFNFEAWKSWTGDELEESLSLGAMATADGFIPFKDPFQDAGMYCGCEDGVEFSKAAGAVSRDAALFAVGSGAFSAGSRSVFYSGGETALAAARAGRGTGLLLENTIGGKALNAINTLSFRLRGKYVIPDWMWRVVSANFALNAKNGARACLRSPSAKSVWETVEKPILTWRRINFTLF